MGERPLGLVFPLRPKAFSAIEESYAKQARADCMLYDVPRCIRPVEEMQDEQILDALRKRARRGESVWEAARRICFTVAINRTKYGRAPFKRAADLLNTSMRVVCYYVRGQIGRDGNRTGAIVDVDVPPSHRYKEKA